MELTKVRIHVLVDNYVTNPGKIMGEWGLALLVELHYDDGTVRHLLYDVGQSGDVLLNNATRLGLDLCKVTHIVLSHGHYDHVGGLVKVLEFLNERGRKPVVLAHPAVFSTKLVVRGGEIKYIGAPFRKEDVENRSWLILTRDPVSVLPKVTFSGEVMRFGYPEYTPDMYTTLPDGRLVRDSMVDDAALIINTRRGLIILTGCGHSGILNILEHARTITGTNKVFAIIGGLHQEREPEDSVVKLCKELEKRGVEHVVPLHCTGMRAVSVMLRELKDRVTLAGAGSTITLSP